MYSKVLKVNISQFDEEEFQEQEQEQDIDTDTYLGEDGEFDTDKFIADFEAQQTQPEEDVQHDEQQPEETPETNAEEPQDQDEPNEEEEKEKRTPDQAFAELRRKAEQNEKYAKFLNDLATKQGLSSPDDLMSAWEERQIEEEAKQQNVPVDVYKRLKSLEQENQQAKQEAFSEKFNRDVEDTIQQYDLKDGDVQGVFQFMGENGFINQDNTTNISFQDAYILANKDNLFQQAEERGKQALLEAEKKKQESSTVNTGTGKSTPSSSGELDTSEEGILKQFAKFGIDID